MLRASNTVQDVSGASGATVAAAWVATDSY
jgi:hypothetical protein